MRSLQTTPPPLILSAGVVGLLLCGCGSGSLLPGAPSEGGVYLIVVPSVSATAGPVVVGARLTVSPGAGPAFTPFTVELSSLGGQFGASLTGIPAGPGRQFSIVGYDAQAAVAAQGSTVADVLQGGSSQLVVVLNQAPGGVTSVFTPIIDQIALTESAVAPLGSVGLVVTAHAADGSAVTLLWTAGCGSFTTDPTAASVTWLAPAVAGACDVSVTATGSSPNSVTVQLSIAVGP